MAQDKTAETVAMVFDPAGPGRWLEAATEISTATLEGVALPKVLQLVADAARQLVGGDLAMIATPEIRSSSLLVRVVSGDDANTPPGMSIPYEGSLAGDAMHSGRGSVVADARVDVRAYEPNIRAFNIGPAIVMPLSARGHAFGVLGISRRPGRAPFDPADLERVSAFAGQAAVALEYARAQRELRRLAVMADRERIARDLHDGAIQALFAVGLNLQATALRATNATVKSRLQESIDQIDGVIRDLRNYIFGLRPDILGERTLDGTLERLAIEFEQRSGIVTVAEVDARVASSLERVAPDLVQMVRETLSNVGRHSQATTCRMSLRRREGEALLEIDDDGRGFDPAHVVTAGQGLRDLRERAAAVGGTVEITSTIGEGTGVRIRVPIPPTARPA